MTDIGANQRAEPLFAISGSGRARAIIRLGDASRGFPVFASLFGGLGCSALLVLRGLASGYV